MSLIYYPNRLQKGKKPVADQWMAQRKPQQVTRTQSIAVTGIDYELNANDNWQVNSVMFEFSAAVARDYSVAVKNGRTIVEDINDALYFQTPNTLPQRIVLDPGFYDDVTLPVEIKAQMDANAAFAALGLTFTIAYTAATGLFAITPSSGTLRYLNTNQMVAAPRLVDSIGGHVVGLTADTAYAANVTSDTEVYGLGSEAPFINEAASVVLTDYDDDVHTLTVDQALHVETSVANLTVTFSVNYEELI